MLVGDARSVGIAVAAEPDPHPNSEETQSDLTIYYPQNGPKVPEDKEYTVGSFTVANRNDTNGNEVADVNDAGALVADSPLTADASGMTVVVADGSKFPAKVNGAPNRIRVKDDDGGELVYIESVTGNEITVAGWLARAYRKDKHGKIEIGEVDLMKLKLDSPKSKPPTGNAVLTIVKGNIKLWDDENKTSPPAGLAGNTLTVPIASLPKCVWIECGETDETKLTMQGIELQLVVGTATDAVRATAVWAKRINFWDSAATNPNPPPPKKLNGEETGTGILTTFRDRFDSDLGMGTFHGFGQGQPWTIGGRCEQQFQLYPAGVGNEPHARLDVSRQGGWRYYCMKYGDRTSTDPADLPSAGWNRFEVANDDLNDGGDGNTPVNDHVHSIDGPDFDTSENLDFLVIRASFHEFVRWRFGLDASFPSPREGPNVLGSRGSPLEPWHLLMYAKRAQQALGQSGSFTQDATAVSASFAIPSSTNTGNGTCTGTPDPAKGVTEGWKVTYVAASDTWQVDGTDGITGTLARVGGIWTGDAKKGQDTRIHIEIQPGNTAFADGDVFMFSTFKTAVTKVNEIKTGSIDWKVGP